jgi:hypothetical protein
MATATAATAIGTGTSWGGDGAFGRRGPWKDSSGTLWTAMFVGATVQAFKSTDNGATWTGDGVGTPAASSAVLDVVFDGAGLWVLTADASFALSVAHFAGGAWTTYTGGPTVSPDGNNDYPAMMVRRPNGDLVVFYQTTANVMG